MQHIPNLILSRTFALLIVITGAAWLRFFTLGDWSFWHDEALTVSDSLFVFNSHLPWDVIHGRPLNFWISGWVFSHLPVSEWSARFVPCLIGVMTIPLIYYLSRELLGKSAAMLSAAFLGLSTWHIYWSQNARGYTLLLFFSLLSMGFFYVGVEKGHRLFLIGSLVALALAYLAHPVALFMLLAYCIYLALIALSGFERPLGYRIRVLWAFFVPLLVLSVFAIPGVLRLAHGVLDRSHGGSAFYVFASIGYYVQPVVLVLALSGVAFLLLRRSRVGLFLASLIGVPLVCLLTLSEIRGGSAVYVFHTLPVYYMGAAITLAEVINCVEGRRKALGVAMALAVLGLQAGMLFEYFTYQYGDRPRWEEASEYVASVINPGDVIGSDTAPVVEYYLGSRTFKLRKPEKVVSFGEFYRHPTNEKLPNHEHSAWLLLRSDRINAHSQSAGQKKMWLESHCGIMRIFEAWTSAKNRSVVVYRCEL